MLWTVFKIFVVVWMLQLVFRFGGNAIQLVLVVSLAALLLRLGIPHASFECRQAARLLPRPEGLTRTIAKQFAGAGPNRDH
jgi:Family of unknown function (DUF5670)